jgi:putative spermidine/putrescine transport system permease protein
VTSFGTAAAIQFPIKGFTLDWYGNALRSETMLESFKLSLIVGLLATILALLVGVPASYALARYTVKGKNLIKSFFLSPTVIPGIVVGYTLFQFIVVALGLPVFQGLLIGHFLISLPYIIRVVGSSMDQLDYSIEEVAWTLGCTRFRAFMQIVLPNVSSGIFAAFMLAFVNSFNNVPVSMFLSGPGVTMLPTSLLSYMEYNYDPTVSAISVMLMLLTIGLMYLIEKTLGLASIA